jgi:hypothetical protein
VKGETLDYTHTLCLHCQGNAYEVAPDGAIGLKYTAFVVHDDGISFNWLEYEGDTFDEQFQATCKLLRLRTVRASHRVALMNIGKAISVGRDNDIALVAVHDPQPDYKNLAHALLQGAAPADIVLLQEFTMG